MPRQKGSIKSKNQLDFITKLKPEDLFNNDFPISDGKDITIKKDENREKFGADFVTYILQQLSMLFQEFRAVKQSLDQIDKSTQELNESFKSFSEEMKAHMDFINESIKKSEDDKKAGREEKGESPDQEQTRGSKASKLSQTKVIENLDKDKYVLIKKDLFQQPAFTPAYNHLPYTPMIQAPSLAYLPPNNIDFKSHHHYHNPYMTNQNSQAYSVDSEEEAPKKRRGPRKNKRVGRKPNGKNTSPTFQNEEEHQNDDINNKELENPELITRYPIRGKKPKMGSHQDT